MAEENEQIKQQNQEKLKELEEEKKEKLAEKEVLLKKMKQKLMEYDEYMGNIPISTGPDSSSPATK